MGAKLEALMKKINKEDVIATVGLPTYDYVRIPFSSPRMNYCTFGGIPTGKIVEFYGEQHGGKTTTALDIVANYQKMENAKEVLWVDVENTLDPIWSSKLGVDIKSLNIIKPVSQSAEELLQIILDAIETGEIGLVVLDSIASMVSLQALEKEITEKTYGGISVALSNFAPKAEMLCQKHNCTLIGINQVRDVIGSMFPMERTPGGRQWMHLCIARFEFRKGQYVDDKGNTLSNNCENPAGNIVLMKMTKNKTCPPTRRLGSYTINYLTGVDAMLDMFDLAIKFGAINKRGGWFDIYNLDTGEVIKESLHGQTAVFDYLKSNEDIYKLLTSQILNKMEEE